MSLSKKIIEILKKPESKIRINGDLVFFEAFEEPYNYNKGLVITSDGFNVSDDTWNIVYSLDGDLFELNNDDTADVEGWIITYYESVTGKEI